MKKRVERENAILHNSFDLKARSMLQDNLIFHDIKENPGENTTAVIHKLLEEKLNIVDVASKVKIDRSSRLGKPRRETDKPRSIVAKLNYYQEYILANETKGDKRSNLRTIFGGNNGNNKKTTTEVQEGKD